MLKRTMTIVLSVLMIFPISAKAESRYEDSYSKSAIVSDYDTGRTVFEKNSDKKRPMASMSKIMTLLLTFDAIKDKKVTPDDVVVIKKSDYNREGTNMKLEAGDKIPLKVLMDSMMIISANDSALAISRYVGGNYANFELMMNKKAKEIGMNNTRFYNPNGLPTYTVINGKKSYVENITTAKDVLILSKWIYNHYPSELVAITSKKRFIYKPKSIDSPNTNPLLTVNKEVDGIKTGFTDGAGYCLSYTMKLSKNNFNVKRNRLFGVTMGATSKENREKAASTALNFISKHYRTELLYKKNQSVVKTNVNNFPWLKADVVVDKDIYMYKRADEKIKTKIVYNENNIFKGLNSPVGKLYIYDQYGVLVRATDVYLKENFEKMNIANKFLFSVSTIYNQIINYNNSGEKAYASYKLK